ncbi:putative reverse transcriptase domain-containing protein [Tanacetum coccineum]
MACNPKEYDGKRGAIALTRWIEKMENVIDNIQARGREAAIGMSWTDFKAFACRGVLSLAMKLEELELGFGIIRWWEPIMPAISGSLLRFGECSKQPNQPQSKVQFLELGYLLTILRAEILTEEAVSYGTLTKGNDKRKVVEESSKSGGSWKDNKKAKVGTGFVVIAPSRNEFASSNSKCSRCNTHHPANGPCNVCFNCQKPGHFARNCWAPIRQVALVNAVRMGNNPRVCYECGSPYHFRNNFPKMNQGSGQPRNQLALEGSLLFDSRADFSFISTEFVPLLNVKPSIVNPVYVIEVADGKKVEVDRIIRDCKLELGSYLFSINLIPLGHRSFDVIVGMDWLSQHKAVIACHEKVVEIPVEDGRTLRVHGERTIGSKRVILV